MAGAADEIIDSSTRSFFNGKELWRYHELFYFFTWRDIKIKYKQTVIGFLWSVLQPLVMMLIFTFFFARALNVPSQNVAYPVYAFSGLLIWNIFSSGLTNASTSMVTNASIIRKIYFPRLIIPVSSIMVAVFDFLMAFVLFIALLLFYHQPVDLIAFACWPAAILIAIMATLGPGCWLAALNVKYRDFRYIIPFLVQILFFINPVIYPIRMLKYPFLQYITAASPLYAAIELFRFPITHELPNPDLVLLSLGSGVVFLLIGMVYFRRTEDYFADFA